MLQDTSSEKCTFICIQVDALDESENNVYSNIFIALITLLIIFYFQRLV